MNDKITELLNNTTPTLKLLESFYDNTVMRNTYPPFNAIDAGDGKIVFQIAAAGITKENIKIFIDNDQLQVVYKKPEETTDRNYIERFIAMRSFHSRFIVYPGTEITAVDYSNGIIIIELELVREEKKVKMFTL